MNADERNNQQQGYGQQDDKQANQQHNAAQGQQQQQPTAQDDESTGQASYGNSGESDTGTISQNISDTGQEADLGQSDDPKLFSGSDDDLGGSASSGQQGGESDASGMRSTDQSFADQGQGAMLEDTKGSDGTTDIEVERSQGRESDIEGSSL